MPRRTHSIHPLSSSLTGRDNRHSRRGIYGVDGWARLDRVQELGDGAKDPNTGHIGCVNALSWSDDGGILLSGSDDKRLCIWTPDTEPASAEAQRSPHPFKLSERIVTGHRANIFCARFLPHASTPTVVSCAGDGDIRVFEIERLLSADAVGRSGNYLWGVDGPGVRVLRCHEDRTKRIATQGQPNLFLSVSEDGTVRQHDLRLPHECRSECPQPLFRAPPGVDLYSLSLSPLAPHIFAVAGQTDCAYICDGRMLPRQTPSWGPHTHRASQVFCVRRLGLPDSEWESVGSNRTRQERHITCVRMSVDKSDEVICAFAMHSTSLFSLNEDPAESSARVKQASVLSPNPGSNTAKGNKKKAAVGTTQQPRRPKRALSHRSQDPRPFTLPRRRDILDGDDAGGYTAEQFLRSPSGSREGSPHTTGSSPRPDIARMEDIVAEMDDTEREALDEVAASRLRTLGGGSDVEAGSSGASAEGRVARRAIPGPPTPVRRNLPDWDVDSDEEEIDLARYRRALGQRLSSPEAQEGGDDGDESVESDNADHSQLGQLRRAQRSGNVEEWAAQYLQSRGPPSPPTDGEDMVAEGSEGSEHDTDMEIDEDDFEGEDDFGDFDDEDDMPYYHGALSRDGQFRDVDMLYPRRMFRGARNMETVKDCNFLGDSSDKVCSGSDDGMFFVWDKETGKLQGIWQGDEVVVNVMEQHPTLPIVAVSGIDDTIKVFAPTSTPPRPSYNCTDQADYIIERNSFRPMFRPAHEPSAFQLLARLMARPDGSLPVSLLDLMQAAQGRSAGDV